MIPVRQCRTAQEVLDNFRAVRSRTRAWREPQKKISPKKSTPRASEPRKEESAPPLAPMPQREPPPPMPISEPRKQAVVGARPALWVTVKRIGAEVAAARGIDPDGIFSTSRAKRYAEPRHMVCWLTKAVLPRASTAQIGRAMSRDHSSVIHALRMVASRMLADPAFSEAIEALRERVRPLAN